MNYNKLSLSVSSSGHAVDITVGRKKIANIFVYIVYNVFHLTIIILNNCILHFFGENIHEFTIAFALLIMSLSRPKMHEPVLYFFILVAVHLCPKQYCYRCRKGKHLRIWYKTQPEHWEVSNL